MNNKCNLFMKWVMNIIYLILMIFYFNNIWDIFPRNSNLSITEFLSDYHIGKCFFYPLIIVFFVFYKNGFFRGMMSFLLMLLLLSSLVVISYFNQDWISIIVDYLFIICGIFSMIIMITYFFNNKKYLKDYIKVSYPVIIAILIFILFFYKNDLDWDINIGLNTTIIKVLMAILNLKTIMYILSFIIVKVFMTILNLKTIVYILSFIIVKIVMAILNLKIFMFIFNAYFLYRTYDSWNNFQLKSYIFQ